MSIDTKDLVSRLRIIGPTLPNDKGFSTTVPQAVAVAADTIEALEGEVERLNAENREHALSLITLQGQAWDNHTRALEAEARAERLLAERAECDECQARLRGSDEK